MKQLAHLLLAALVLLGLPVQAQYSKSLYFNIGDAEFEMMYVQGGQFLMGTMPNALFLTRMPSSTEASRLTSEIRSFRDESPRHAVEVNSFYLGKYEVTQELFEAVMGYNPSNFKGPYLPVEQVSYTEALEFIQRLNQITGKQFRLPTEAEWEYAARGGQSSMGYPYPGGNEPMRIGWSKLNSQDESQPVGGLMPNELGIYDLYGNVWEWCSDWYNPVEYLWQLSEHYNRPKWVESDDQLVSWAQKDNMGDLTYYIGRTYYIGIGRPEIPDNTIWNQSYPNIIKNPQGHDTGEFRVGRGGSWADEGGEIHTAYRNFWVPDKKLSNVGFRLCLSYNNDNLGSWIPNQYIIDSVNSNNEIISTTSTHHIDILKNGGLVGAFSVAPGKQVHFSRGNLQYNPATLTWRFADHQTDYIGKSNLEYSDTYAGWIDLFSWGTSGYHKHTPTYYSTNNKNFGNGKDKNIDGTAYDWGIYNAISNGGNRSGRWRTLSAYEWHYLFALRPNAAKLRNMAQIGDVSGYILFPDDWIERGLDTLSQKGIAAVQPSTWRLMERAGAVFLPMAGICHFQSYTAALPLQVPENNTILIEGINTAYGTLMPQSSRSVQQSAETAEIDPETGRTISGSTSTNAEREFWKKVFYKEPVESDRLVGHYWTTTHYDEKNALKVSIILGYSAYIQPDQRSARCSVRLVTDITEK